MLNFRDVIILEKKNVKNTAKDPKMCPQDIPISNRESFDTYLNKQIEEKQKKNF